MRVYNDVDGLEKLYYLHTDNLGSIQAITDENKAIVSSYYYTPWGGRILLSGANITDRGYTFHEHLEPFGLINMNGRVYDPVLARFLSPDNYVQAPDYTQGFNRYSYCLNNPLIYTDPSGEFVWFIITVAIVNAGMNVYQNWDAIKEVHGWKAIGRFAEFAAVGAGRGVLSAVYGPVGGIVGGTLEAGLNSAIRGENLKNILTNTGVGLLSNAIGVGIGFGMEKLTTLGLDELGVNNVLARNVTSKVVGSVSQTFTTSLSDGLLRGKNLKQSFEQASDWRNLTFAAVSGALEGLDKTYYDKNNITNTQNQPDVSPTNPADNMLNLNKIPLVPLQPLTPNLQPALPPAPVIPALPPHIPIMPPGHFEIRGDHWMWVR